MMRFVLLGAVLGVLALAAAYRSLPECVPMVGGGCSYTLGTMG